MSKEISVVIPNFNGEAFLENCLNSLKEQSFKDFEVIIVDDCSTDNGLMILKNHPEIRLILNEKNSGFAVSVNNGIRVARGRYVLLLNNDVVVADDFVEKLYQAIDKDERIFSVSSRMIRYYERDKIDDTGDFYNVLGWAYKRGDGKNVSRLLKSSSVFSTCAGAGIY
ncbi:MAG: glycosyltransferase family 2 protein, partial [Eubacterium callanderi]